MFIYSNFCLYSLNTQSILYYSKYLSPGEVYAWGEEIKTGNRASRRNLPVLDLFLFFYLFIFFFLFIAQFRI